MSETEDKLMKAKDEMAEVNEILRYTAEKKKCNVSDLQWKVDGGGNIHIRRKQDAVR